MFEPGQVISETVAFLNDSMGRQEGLPHLDQPLPHRDASGGAAADMRTRHPAALA